MKVAYLILLLSVTTCKSFAQCSAVDYTVFESIQEVLEFESACIASIDSYEYEKLADLYAARGESFLFCGSYKLSLEDFQRSYAIALNIEDRKEQCSATFRALFGQALIFAYLDMPDNVYPLVHALYEIMDSAKCTDCNEKNDDTLACLPGLSLSTTPYYILLCEDVPIYGPDQISVKDCIDLIDNTVELSRILIYKAPSALWPILSYAIDCLAKQARTCCAAGGIWKGCFQKLANKYHLWNQKWKVLGIPPDPAWD